MTGAAFSAGVVRLPPFQPGMRIGLFGGSFDPPHQGHVMVSETALRRLRLDRVWWLVSPGNPLKSWMPSSAEERLARCRALIRDPRIIVSDVEVQRGNPYSRETLRFLYSRMPGVKIVWLVGADIFATFHWWKDWEELALMIPVAVFDRPGATLAAAASPAARLLAHWRLPEAEAPLLADCRPPAWVFIHGRHLAASSTALRAGHPKR
jgi:nicotinate-nucleotide adenylyltransferase